jgi:hypothetical protein
MVTHAFSGPLTFIVFRRHQGIKPSRECRNHCLVAFGTPIRSLDFLPIRDMTASKTHLMQRFLLVTEQGHKLFSGIELVFGGTMNYIRLLLARTPPDFPFLPGIDMYRINIVVLFDSSFLVDLMKSL